MVGMVIRVGMGMEMEMGSDLDSLELNVQPSMMDDEDVCRMQRHMLSSLGYPV